MKSRWLVHGVWAVIAIMLALGVGILMREKSHGLEKSVTTLAEPGDVIDQDLMIALGQAKNFHYKAKVYMSDGKSAEAIAAVREILSLQFPPGAPEAEDVRNDARALLAKLLLEKDAIDEAMRVVDEGLAQSTRESFFVANLHTVKGELYYARASKLDPSDPKGVTDKRSAIDELDTSIKINLKIQKQLGTK